jgi:hypothetical protein
MQYPACQYAQGGVHTRWYIGNLQHVAAVGLVVVVVVVIVAM